jgi:hypothetical protein
MRNLMRARAFAIGPLALGIVGLGMVTLGAGTASADLPPTESATLGDRRVTIYTWAFLAEGDLAALRAAMTDAQALAGLVPADGKGGFAAVAVSPDEPFLTGSVLVAPAQAVTGLPTLEEAWNAAYAGCNALRKGQTDCTIVLEIAPK